MKKTLAILLAILIAVSSALVVSAAEQPNYKLTTEFYADDGSGNFVPVTSVPAGSNVKMRVSIETNFVSGSATMLFAYDKEALSAEGLSANSSREMTLNEDFEFVDKKIQSVIGANGQKAANNQVVAGNLTPEQANEYGFLVFSTRTNGCVVYDGSDWIFELDMKVLKGSKGKKLECIVLPETVCTVENNRGAVSFPYAPSISSPSTDLVSAFNWYEGTPVLESVQVTVTPSLTERSITWIVDGKTEKVDYYEIGDAITADWFPEKEGYNFICWSSDVPDTMPDANLVFTAQFDIISYNINFDANSGAFADGTNNSTVFVFHGDEIPADEIPVKAGYEFCGWSESIGGSAVVLGDATSDKTYYAIWSAMQNIPYTVETYTMKPDGSYALVSASLAGTTDETVTAEYTVPEGFVLDGANSVLSGVVAADGSLVLKVYIVRKAFAFTTDVDGVVTSTNYLYGAEIKMPATPVKVGYEFAGWSAQIPATMPANDVTVTANWIAADDVAYTVETYTMGTDGTYALSTTAHTGTTDETVTAEYTVPEGFALNVEKSVVSGTVAPDGSLVLKVYIDRKTYRFSTDVDGIVTSTDYLYGQEIATPATPSKQGFAFTGWSEQIPSTMPANDITVTANLRCTATVNIKNNPGTKTIKYGEKLRLTAETANLPEGAKLYWYVDGEKKGEGTTFEVSPKSGSVEVTVKVVDKNGNPYSEPETSDSQRVAVKAGFFQKIISFFKNLFGMNRTIVQFLNRI